MFVPLQPIDWRSALGASACVLLAAAAAPAWAEGNAEAQRRAELRSSVRQQQSAPAATVQRPNAAAAVPPAASPAPAPAHAPALVTTASYHHLSEQQRGEMRRQLARDLRAQGKP
jgi:hypothetical protein